MGEDNNQTIFDQILQIARANHPKKARKQALIDIQQLAAKAHFMTENHEEKFILERVINAAGNVKKKGRAFKDVIWEAGVFERRQQRGVNVGTVGYTGIDSTREEDVSQRTY